MIFGFGDTAYILENHIKVTPVMVLDRTGDMYTVRIRGGAMRVRHSRLYSTREEAEKNVIRLGEAAEPAKAGERTFGHYRSPYDWVY